MGNYLEVAKSLESQQPVVTRIVSGGQTGVDRAALDVAIELGLSHGGWCPRGRKAEDGVIAAHYDLQETSSSHYYVRTRRNVLDSDATLILYRDEIKGGTKLTQRYAEQYGKPYLAVRLSDADRQVIRRWLHEYDIRKLNVAGPRESDCPGIYEEAKQCLAAVLSG